MKLRRTKRIPLSTLAALRDVLYAADVMRDDWAEGDEGRKRDLWRRLHSASDRAWDSHPDLQRLLTVGRD